MKKTIVSTTKEEAVTVVTTDVTKHRIEHLMTKNEFGENGYMIDTNADIYRCLAFMYSPTSGLLDYGLNAWNLDYKTGIINDEMTLQSELAMLANYLKEAGVIELQSIDYEFEDADTGANEVVLLKFNFADNSTFVVNPLLQNLVK